jgi:uncharacterized membrane protein
MIIVLPLGLWVFSFVADILHFNGVGSYWHIVSAYAMAGGVVGALLSAVPGFIDYFALKDKAAKQIATWHMMMNLGAVVLYSYNFWLRYTHHYQAEGLPFILSIATIILLTISGWLGGELVYVHRVGVLEQSELNSK